MVNLDGTHVRHVANVGDEAQSIPPLFKYCYTLCHLPYFIG